MHSSLRTVESIHTEPSGCTQYSFSALPLRHKLGNGGPWLWLALYRLGAVLRSAVGQLSHFSHCPISTPVVLTTAPSRLH